MTYTVRYRDREVRFEEYGGPSIERYLSQGRYYEPDMLEYIEALQLSGTYVDVGAYVGTHAIFFAVHCPATKVHAFEPVGEFHEVLARNVATNHLESRIVLHRAGLSEVEKTVETELEGKRSVIACRRLDDLLDEPIALIKIDVEGMEMDVLRGAERLLRQHRPLIFFEAHTAKQLADCAEYLARFGYEGTGRVFNASPTYEFVANDSPTAPRRILPHAAPLLLPSLWVAPYDYVSLEWHDGVMSGTADIAEGERVHVSHDKLGFDEPPVQPTLMVEPGSTIFLQMNGVVEQSVAVAVHLFQFSDGQAITKERIGTLPRLFRRLSLDPATTAIRLVLRITGKGEFRIERFALHARHESEIERLRAELRRVQAQRTRERTELDAVRKELRLLRSECEWMLQVRDEEVAHEREQNKKYQTVLDATFRRLESTRKSVTFRIGRATKAAVSGSRTNMLATPRLWLETFRGPDEIVEELRNAALTSAPTARSRRAEVAGIESSVLLLGLPPPTRPTGIAGVVGPRFAAELGSTTRFRLLDPHSWRYLLESERPAYVLITTDGILPGTAWGGWGTSGGRDGAAMLRELSGWCQGHRIPVVYWDTLGTGRLPRGMAFEALFTVSERHRSRLGPAAEVLAPAIEPLVWNPIGVVPGPPRNPIYIGAFDRRGDRAELDRLAEVLGAGAVRGLEIVDINSGIQGMGAASVQFPASLAGLVRPRLLAEAERAAIKNAGLLVCHSADSDYPAWDVLRGLALGAHVLSTPAQIDDGVLASVVELAGTATTAGDALERLVRRPRLDASWRRAFERVLTHYSLRDRLDHIARRCGTAPVAEPAPSAAVIARLRGKADVTALRAFLAAQTVAPVEVRVVADRGLDAGAILGEIVDPSRIVSLDDSNRFGDSDASHLVCWSTSTPPIPEAIAELTRSATLVSDDVLVVVNGAGAAGAALYRHGGIPREAVIAVRRAAAVGELREGVAPAEVAATLASNAGCLIKHSAGRDRGLS